MNGCGLTPAQAWAELVAGNERFCGDQLLHPHQDSDRRSSLTGGQAPSAVFFGCGDSRVAAEVIFDRGLGDLFVVRTAGHVTDPGVLGSIEFGVEILAIPLIVVLAHDSCGAIAATIEAFESGTMPGGFMRDIVERISPSMLAAHRAGLTDPDQIGAEHVRQTIALLADRSQIIARAVDDGRLAIVGAAYALKDGHARVVGSLGL